MFRYTVDNLLGMAGVGLLCGLGSELYPLHVTNQPVVMNCSHTYALGGRSFPVVVRPVPTYTVHACCDGTALLFRLPVSKVLVFCHRYVLRPRYKA